MLVPSFGSLSEPTSESREAAGAKPRTPLVGRARRRCLLNCFQASACLLWPFQRDRLQTSQATISEPTSLGCSRLLPKPARL